RLLHSISRFLKVPLRIPHRKSLTGRGHLRLGQILRRLNLLTNRTRSSVRLRRKPTRSNTRRRIGLCLLQRGLLRVSQRVSLAVNDLPQGRDLGLSSLPLTVRRVVLLQVPIKRAIHPVNRVTLTNDVTLQILKRNTELLGHVDSRLGILEKRPEPVVLVSRQGVVDALHRGISSVTHLVQRRLVALSVSLSLSHGLRPRHHRERRYT